MPSKENERYRKYDRSEFPAIVSLVNDSRGRYVSSPEELVGGGVIFYITTKGGVHHTYGNNANFYLVIDGESYRADYGWLSSWEYDKGNMPLPDGFFENVISPSPVESDNTLIPYYPMVKPLFPTLSGYGVAHGSIMVGSRQTRYR
jgi:hypothetical protein